MLEVFRQLSIYALYLVFPAILCPFLIASLFFKTFPSKNAVWFFLVVSLFSFLCFLFSDAFSYSSQTLVILDVIVFVVFFYDWLTCAFSGRKTTFKRNIERVVSQGFPVDVELIVENRSDRSVILDFVDDLDDNSRAVSSRSDDDLLVESKLVQETSEESSAAYFDRRTISGNTSETVSYRLIWNRRGSFSLYFVAARFWSRLGLWRKYVKCPCFSSIQVYPNLCQLSQFNGLGRMNRLFLLGVRQIRRVGQDADFERLRDYTQDDQYKFIDWKATARRNKLIVRDFQDTRNQRVIIALDAGRMMTNRSHGGTTLFDAALNASLALSYIALKQGDEVGLIVFSKEVKRFVAPRGGISQMNTLIRAVFDAFPEQVESRYDLAFEYLSSKSPKRALVVLATNVLDERNARMVEKALIGLSGAHLTLGIFLRERSLFDSIERWEKRNVGESKKETNLHNSSESKAQNRLATWFERFNDEREPIDEIERLLWKDAVSDNPSSTEIFYRAGAAANILNWRKKTLRVLESKGALTLDVFPEEIVAPLVNKYFEVKARRLL